MIRAGLIERAFRWAGRRGEDWRRDRVAKVLGWWGLCIACGELLNDPENMKTATDEGDGVVLFECPQCSAKQRIGFDIAPVPINLGLVAPAAHRSGDPA